MSEHPTSPPPDVRKRKKGKKEKGSAASTPSAPTTPTTPTAPTPEREVHKQEATSSGAPVKKAPEEDLKGFNLLFVIAQLVGVTMLILIAVHCHMFQGSYSFEEMKKLYNWHPLLATTGFVYLNANAMMVIRALRHLDKQVLLKVHAAIHSAVLLTVITSLAAIFIPTKKDFAIGGVAHPHKTDHEFMLMPHAYSLHSWIGYFTLVVYLAEWISAIVICMCPQARQHVNSLSSAHIFFGIAVFMLSVGAALTGIQEQTMITLGDKYTKYLLDNTLMNVIGTFMVVFAMFVTYLVIEPKYHRSPRAGDTTEHVLIASPSCPEHRTSPSAVS